MIKINSKRLLKFLALLISMHHVATACCWSTADDDVKPKGKGPRTAVVAPLPTSPVITIEPHDSVKGNKRDVGLLQRPSMMTDEELQAAGITTHSVANQQKSTSSHHQGLNSLQRPSMMTNEELERAASIAEFCAPEGHEEGLVQRTPSTMLTAEVDQERRFTEIYTGPIMESNAQRGRK